MKHIGYTNGKTWGSDFPSGPVKLFIPEPGMRENVSADHYEHIGWIIPDSDDRSNVWSGKGIYETHEHAGPDSRPAYVVREAAAAPMVPAGSGHMLTEPMVPTQPVTREEFEALVLRVDAISASIAPAPAAPVTVRLDVAIHTLLSCLEERPPTDDGVMVNADWLRVNTRQLKESANIIRQEIDLLRGFKS